MLDAKSEDRFGLCEARRREAFRAWWDAETRATHDAKARVPVRDDLPRDQMLELFKRQAQVKEELFDEYGGAVLKNYGVTRKQMGEIGAEAFRKNWSVPPTN